MRPLPNPAAQAALSSRTAYIKEVVVTAIRGSDQIALEIASGTFTQDGRRSMRWSGDITVNVDEGSPLIDVSPQNILTPFGTEIQVELGIELADGSTSVVPYGTYVIDKSSMAVSPSARSVSMTLIDVATRIEGYRFETPLGVAPADIATVVNTVVANRLGVSPNLSPVGRSTGATWVFGLEASNGPWRELQDLVESFDHRLWYDRQGNLVLDPVPTPNAANQIPLVGPLNVSAAFDARPPNVMVARGERSDDTPPVTGVAMDNDPASPTWAGVAAGGSPYGRITQYFASPMLVTQGQADNAARSLLVNKLGAGASWRLTRPFDPTFDPDDVVSVSLSSHSGTVLVVDSVSVNILGETSMTARAFSTGGQ